MPSAISRVFMNGNSQAVRIPQEFRLDTSRVQITRNEQGDLVIRALHANRGMALLQALRGFEDDALTDEFVSQVIADRREPQPVQERQSF